MNGSETVDCDPKARQDCHSVSLGYIQKSEDLRSENVRLKDALKRARETPSAPK